MDKQRLNTLSAHYRQALLDDVVPFWLKHSLDWEYGGYFNMLDRDGAVFDTDKAMWLQGRAVWMFSRLYNALEPRPEWLGAARLGYDFLMKHGFDTDGRMFFRVTRDGRPLRKRRYFFTETFATIACAEYARASGDAAALRRAKTLYELVVELYHHPDRLPPKVIPATRNTQAHAMPMILLATSQELRRHDVSPICNEIAQDMVDRILTVFVKPEQRALFETVDADGSLLLDAAEGRTINPGHAIESAWFIMREGDRRGDMALIQQALDIVRWSLEIGWDTEYGGLLYFVDYEGKPPTQLEWDQKLWWPHTEALYALLLAFRLTGEDWCEEWYEKVHDWAFSHFPDLECGEWYGYLRRDGSILTPLKASTWKGFFHLPRALLNCLLLLNEWQ